MKKSEFEKKIKELKLEKIYQEGSLQSYSQKQREYYREKERESFYGCYYDSELKRYVIFFKDSERNVVKHLGNYKTEDEAYDNLFKEINEWKDEFQKSNKK